jgi:hypothetical protein
MLDTVFRVGECERTAYEWRKFGIDGEDTERAEVDGSWTQDVVRSE